MHTVDYTTKILAVVVVIYILNYLVMLLFGPFGIRYGDNNIFGGKKDHVFSKVRNQSK